MNVLHLISSSGFFGAERVVCELCRQSGRFGVDARIAVLARDGELYDNFKRALAGTAVQVDAIPCAGKFDLAAVRHLKRIVSESGINIVHSHGYKSDLYAFVLKKLFRLPIALFATNHNWIGLTLNEKIYQGLDALALRRFSKIVAVSEQVRQDMVRRCIPAEKLELIFNGIDTEDPDFDVGRQDVREELGIGEPEFVIGTVARLTAEKNHAELIQAFYRLRCEAPEARLVIVGDGPERAGLTALIESMGLGGSVMLTGNSSRARAWLAGLDLFVLPSLNEGLPMVLLEAMAAGVPVIASPVGAIPLVIEHGVNGWLVAPGVPDQLAEACSTLRKESGLRRQMAAAGKAVVKERFSSVTMTARYKDLYHSVTAGGR